MELLDDEDRSRAARIASPARRASFVGRRAVVREILSTYTGERPAALRFREGPHGKPALESSSGLAVPCFNLSHSGKLLVLAVAWGVEVGLDIEEIKPFGENVATLFSLHEQQQIAALSGAHARYAFYRYWTAKEAVSKLLGTGFALPPDQIQISDPTQPLSLTALQGHPVAASSMTLHRFDIHYNVIGAIAIASAETSIALKTWVSP